MNRAVIVVLPKGGSILVDAEDEALACEPGWHLTGNGYVSRVRHGRREYLHRVIMGTPKGMVTDHIDGNERDNRRVNLRVCTYAQNHMNRRVGTYKRVQYKGVHRRSGRTFAATMTIDGEVVTLGVFRSAEEAARAYDDAARKHHGAFACLNFPREGEQCAL